LSGSTSPAFARYVGIDYSGAETPTSSLKGLRVYLADRAKPPEEVPPPPSARKYWTRRGIAEWLAERLAEDPPTLVGIDHGFSFPLRYFEAHHLLPDWAASLEDFQRHWPTDGDHVYVDFVRNGAVGHGAERTGNPKWRRLTETRAGAAKSVFHRGDPLLHHLTGRDRIERRLAGESVPTTTEDISSRMTRVHQRGADPELVAKSRPSG
jgi:hypothetical protein